MKRNSVKQGDSRKSAGSSYYRLHTQAVEDLVSASTENTPAYSKEELDRYRSSSGKLRLPEGLKVLLIKAWIYGAVCYFSFWGLGIYTADQLDLLFVSAVIMGLAGDLLINRCLRFTEKAPGGSGRHIMVTRRGAAGLCFNLLYAFVLLFFVVTIYSAINTLIVLLSAGNGTLLGVEPILFGLFTTLTDTLLIGCKRLALAIVADARNR